LSFSLGQTSGEQVRTSLGPNTGSGFCGADTWTEVELFGEAKRKSTPKISIRSKRRKAGWNNTFLLKVLMA
jgi:hypothetical protein